MAEIQTLLEQLIIKENKNLKQNISYELYIIQEDFFSQTYEKENNRNILFLFISCDTVSEIIEKAEWLWQKQQTLPIICIVKLPEEVFEALPYPFFHIVRAYALEQDLSATLKKMERTRPKRNHWQFFSCKNENNKIEIVRIKIKEILYIESQRHEIQIHIRKKNGEQYVLLTTETLSQCEEKLKKEYFSRIHKSFLVNFYHVEKMEREKITLDNEEILYMSRYRYPEVKNQFEQYIRHVNFLL